MEINTYRNLNILSPKKPINTHLFIELANGALLLIDSTSTTDLLISDNKGVNWNTVQTGSFTDGKISKTNPIISAYYDRANSKLYYLTLKTVANYDLYAWYIDTSTYVETSLGRVDDDVEVWADIYVRNNEVEVIFADILTFNARRWNDPNWDIIDNHNPSMGGNILNLSHTVVIGTIAYLYGDVTDFMCFFKFDGTTIFELDDIADYSYAGDNQSSTSYDDVNIIYSIMTKDADGKQYLMRYSITGDSLTVSSEHNIILMLDRNTASGVKEKAFHLTEYRIYQLQENSFQLHLIAEPDSDAIFIAITDNFLMNNDGDMFERDNALANIESTIINHPIMEAPRAKIKLLKSAFLIKNGITLIINDNYTSQSDTNLAIVFEGRVVDFDDKLLQTVWLESQALKELDKIFPEGTYSGSSQSIINSLITGYCKYITPGTLAAGIAMGSITYEGDKSLRTILLTLIYINNFIWALTPTGALNFNSGAVDSGVDLTETNNVWKVRTGNQGEGMNYWKIRGAIINGSQLEKILQNEPDQLLNGLNPLSETYAELNTQSLVNIMANARKLRTEDVSKIVNYNHYDSTLGFIQPGETKTFEYGYSEPVVAQDQFIIYGVKYRAREGIGDYKIADELV